MNDYRTWRPIYRAMCPEPRPRDLFLVVMMNGKRVSVLPVSDYCRVRPLAEAFAIEQQCQVKVLPMSGTELMNFYGIVPEAPKPMDTLDPAFRAQAVQNCMDAISECHEPRERGEALDLLKQLGALHV